MPDFETIQARTPPQNQPFRLTGWHVGAVALGFFLIVATMNGIMMHHAFRTMPGLDARNGYDVSQHFNASIADARAQTARGWRTDLSIARENRTIEGSTIRLTVTIRDRAGEPISGLAVAITARHPATRALDHTGSALELAPGRYQLAHRLSAGAWDVEISTKESANLPPLILSRNRINVKD